LRLDAAAGFPRPASSLQIGRRIATRFARKTPSDATAWNRRSALELALRKRDPKPRRCWPRKPNSFSGFPDGTDVPISGLLRECATGDTAMKITYEIIEHDGGWAYKVGGTYSETFHSRDDALAAARIAANEQQVAGSTEGIEYEDTSGKWHHEVADGTDRPEADVAEK
jgi:hypothetical protein